MKEDEVSMIKFPAEASEMCRLAPLVLCRDNALKKMARAAESPFWSGSRRNPGKAAACAAGIGLLANDRNKVGCISSSVQRFGPGSPRGLADRLGERRVRMADAGDIFG